MGFALRHHVVSLMLALFGGLLMLPQVAGAQAYLNVHSSTYSNAYPSLHSPTPAANPVIGQGFQSTANKSQGNKAQANKQRQYKPQAKPQARKPVRRAAPPPRPSQGKLAGLHATPDPLELKSSVALVIDEDSREVLVRKNDAAILPIASLTKLMTGIVALETGVSLEQAVMISQEDVDTEKGSRSRLKVGTLLSRAELLHLALMSSENRAAHALARSHPEGLSAFVSLMNAKAHMLGMQNTRFVEPTGLSSQNRSSARDLALLVAAAGKEPLLREYSTSTGYQVALQDRVVNYVNTNRLVLNPGWEIAVQKTGYISEAGQCLVMQAKVNGRRLIMVFLDSVGRLSRLGDAERVRRWLETRSASGLLSSVSPMSALN